MSVSPRWSGQRRHEAVPFPQPGAARPWDEYALVRKLGRGSFGHVYEAVHTPTTRVVAIKQIALEGGDAESEAHMQDLQEIQREIASLAQCQDCGRVTQYFGSFVKKYTLWVVMELMDGGSCLSLLKRGGALPDDVCAVVARELVLGLEYLHAHGIIHRDIKAANVLLTRDGRVKLGTYRLSNHAADFGVAAQLVHRQSFRNTLVGSPYWMAPEVIKQSMYDARADIWSLGITVMELATGSPPLSEYHPMRAMFLIPKAAPPTLGGAHPRDMQHFLERCLVVSPSGRASAKELCGEKWVEEAGSLSVVRRVIEERGTGMKHDTSLSFSDSTVLDTSVLSEWAFDEPGAIAAEPGDSAEQETSAPAAAPVPWPVTPTSEAPPVPSTPHSRTPRPRPPESPSKRTPHQFVPDTPVRIQRALEQLAFLAGQDASELAPVALVHQMHTLFTQLGRHTPEYLDMLVDTLTDPSPREMDAPRIPAARTRLASLLYERWHDALRSRWDVLRRP